MARTLIAGCGDVGTALGRLLCAGGHEVWGLRRSARGLPRPIRAIQGDLSDPASLRTLPRALSAIFYTAAASGPTDDAYRAAYVEGPANLIEALRRAGQYPGRVFFTSSTSVYGQDDGSWVDETSTTDPTSVTGQRVLEGERVFRAGPFPATVVRLGGIYGPGRTRLVTRVRSGVARLAAGPTAFTNRIHRDDCALALAHTFSLDAPAATYVGVDELPCPIDDVYRFLAARLGLPEPVSAATPSAAGLGKRCSSALLRASGFVFRYPTFREGYADLANEGPESGAASG